MDNDAAQTLRPDLPIARTLEAFSVAVEGWVSAVEDLDRFFLPMVKSTPELQQHLEIIYQIHLQPWRERIDALLPELGAFLVGKRQTVRRMSLQRQVRILLESLQSASVNSLKRVFPGSKGAVPALNPIPGLDDVTKRFLQIPASRSKAAAPKPSPVPQPAEPAGPVEPASGDPPIS